MSRRIMVIEDDPETLIMLGQLLEGAGYEVILVPTVDDDLAKVAAAQPDVILVDMMFGRDPLGARMLGAPLGDQSTATIPTIACTGASKMVLMARSFLEELKIRL